MKMESYPVSMRLVNPNTGKKETTEVGMANFPVYDSVDEAVDDKGAEEVLSLLNTQVRTNALNGVRALKRAELEGSLPQKTLYSKAIQRLVASGRIQELAGDEEALNEAIEREKAAIREEFSSKAREAVLAGIGEDEEDES